MRCFSVHSDTPQTCVIHVTQLERDTILVCLDSTFYSLLSAKLTQIIIFISLKGEIPTYEYVTATIMDELFSVIRVYKDSEPTRKVEVKQEVVC